MAEHEASESDCEALQEVLALGAARSMAGKDEEFGGLRMADLIAIAKQAKRTFAAASYFSRLF